MAAVIAEGIIKALSWLKSSVIKRTTARFFAMARHFTTKTPSRKCQVISNIMKIISGISTGCQFD